DPPTAQVVGHRTSYLTPDESIGTLLLEPDVLERPPTRAVRMEPVDVAPEPGSGRGEEERHPVRVVHDHLLERAEMPPALSPAVGARCAADQRGRPGALVTGEGGVEPARGCRVELDARRLVRRGHVTGHVPVRADRVVPLDP